MQIKFSTDLQTILCYARDEAMRTGSYRIGADHIVLGMLRHRDNDPCRLLAACGIDPDAFKAAIDEQLFSEAAVPWQDQNLIRPTPAVKAESACQPSSSSVQSTLMISPSCRIRFAFGIPCTTSSLMLAQMEQG